MSIRAKCKGWVLINETVVRADAIRLIKPLVENGQPILEVRIEGVDEPFYFRYDHRLTAIDELLNAIAEAQAMLSTVAYYPDPKPE